MHILHVTPYYTPAYAFGGVVSAVEGMTYALTRQGHIVTVLTTDALDHGARVAKTDDETVDGPRVVRCANISVGLRGRYNLSTPRNMRAIAQKLMPQIDVVHTHEFRTVENLLVTPVAAEHNKPLVLSPHGTLTHSTGRSRVKSIWDRVLSPAVAQRIDHVVGLTEDEINDAQKLWSQFGQRRIPTTFSAIPNGVNPTQFEDLGGGKMFREWHQLGEGPVCLFMGRLHERKGIDILVQAFKRANVPNARLVITGPDEGMKAKLMSEIDNEQITLTGYLGGADRLAAFAAADMLALPAVGEGLPMVVLEAMAAGLPVIISPECHLPQVAEQGAGIEVEPQVEPLAKALHTLLTDKSRREKMGWAARNLVEKQFTWDAIAVQLDKLYASLVQQEIKA